jgi:hypothetical protein
LFEHTQITIIAQGVIGVIAGDAEAVQFIVVLEVDVTSIGFTKSTHKQ